MEVIRIGNMYGYSGDSFGWIVYDMAGLCPTLNSMQGGGKQPMVIIWK